MKKIIGLLFISSILFSCVRTKEVDINWDEKTLPVVYSFITPDSMVKVLLTESYHGTKVADTFPNTEIYILDENSNQVLLTRLDSVNFADVNKQMNIVAGKTYSLRIDLKNGNPIITASTTVPNEAADFEEYSVTLTDESNEYQKSAFFNCLWQAPTQNKQTDGYFLLTSWYFGMLQVVKKDANTYTTNANQIYYPADNEDYYISLLTTDKWLSLYLTNEEIQSSSLTYGIDFSIVFFSDFSGTLSNFSNIENGVGIFGSYLIHTRDLKGNVIK